MGKVWLVWAPSKSSRPQYEASLHYSELAGSIRDGKRNVVHALTESDTQECQIAVRINKQLREEWAGPNPPPELTPLGFFSKKYPAPAFVSQYAEGELTALPKPAT